MVVDAKDEDDQINIKTLIRYTCKIQVIVSQVTIKMKRMAPQCNPMKQDK